MRDDIFWGNLIGLLKKGKWVMSSEEAFALVAIIQEAEKRSKPLEVKAEMKEPIKKKKD